MKVIIIDDGVELESDVGTRILLTRDRMRVLLEEVLKYCLTEREQEVLRFRFGSDADDPHSREETAQRFHVSVLRICQIEDKAYQKSGFHRWNKGECRRQFIKSFIGVKKPESM